MSTIIDYKKTEITPARIPDKFTWQDHMLLLVLGIVSLLGIYLAIGPSRELPGDEMRFIETSRNFSSGFGLSLLKHYEEMSTPLPFMLFGMWGKLFGFETP